MKKGTLNFSISHASMKRFAKVYLLSIVLIVNQFCNVTLSQSVTEKFKITASDGSSNDKFGTSVGLSGDYAIVGTDATDDNGTSSGSAYIFKRSGSTWLEQAKLIASDATAADFFGENVAISGDYAIIGAVGDEHDNGPFNSTGNGSAYIFKRSGSTWSEQAKLFDSNARGFSKSVDISENHAIVGSPEGDAAYIYNQSGSIWSEQNMILPSDGGGVNANNRFGQSVAIEGNYAIIGSPDDDDLGSDSGSAYIFFWNGTNWVQQTKLTASDGGDFAFFGNAVSIAGNYAVVGGRNTGNGKVYIFERSGSTWTEQAIVEASDGGGNDHFGYSLDLSNDMLIVGAHKDDRDGAFDPDSGSAYIFQRSGNTWIQQNKLIASDLDRNDEFGISVAISANYSISGAFGDDDNGFGSGSAYIHEIGTMSCPQNYSGVNRLVGTQSTVEDYETDGVIQSSQTIDANTDYDSGTCIELLPGFGVNPGKLFYAFIDGCGNL